MAWGQGNGGREVDRTIDQAYRKEGTSISTAGFEPPHSHEWLLSYVPHGRTYFRPIFMAKRSFAIPLWVQMGKVSNTQQEKRRP